jgi:hypothetical protein
MRKIDKVEAATNVDRRNACLLRDDELDAVSGGSRKAGGDQETYLVVKMTDCFVASYRF